MIEAHAIVKEFGEPPQRVLHGIDLRIESGEFVSISGRSGSGKSTLLYILSTLDVATSGHLHIDAHDVDQLGVEELHAFRNKNVGFIFQFHYLLPELTTLENVLLPARNLGQNLAREPRAMELLEQLGIERHAHKYPMQMSGGEQQRVAIARALIMQPKYIFADEPTGNLDTHNSQVVMEMLKKVSRAHQTTVVLVTHDPDYSKMADREIYLVDGRVK